MGYDSRFVKSHLVTRHTMSAAAAQTDGWSGVAPLATFWTAGGQPRLTQVSWKNNINGVWSNAANWSGGAVPGAGNSVLLDTLSARTVTYNSGNGTIGGINAVTDTLNITGGTLTVLGSAVFDAGFTEAFYAASSVTLQLEGSTASVAGTFNPGDGYVILGSSTTLSVTGPAILSNSAGNEWPEIDGGTLVTSNTTTIVDAGSSSYLQAVFGGGIVWTNTGTVNDGGVIQTGDGNGATASFVNAAGAVFDFSSDDGQIENGAVYGVAGAGSSTFSNAGTLEKIGGGGGVSSVYSNVTNTGVVNAVTGTIEFDGGGVFGGTLTGAGQIAFGGGNSTLTAGTSFNVANWAVDGGDVMVATALAYGGNLTLSAGQLTLDGTNDVITGSFGQSGNSVLYLNAGTLSVAGADLSYGTLEGPGTLAVTGTTTLGQSNSYYIGDGATIINSGTVNQDDYVYAAGGGFAIINNSGATYDVNGGYYLDNTYDDSTFSNAGTFALNTGSYFYLYSYFLNTGVLNSNAGTLYIYDGGVFGGTLTGAGVIDFANGESTLTAGAVYSAANLEVGGGDLTLDANATPANASFSQSGGAVYLNGNTLTLANASLGYGGYLEGGGSLLTSGGTGLYSNYFIGNSVEWVNTGTVDQDGNLYVDSSAPSSFDLRNQAGATYNITGGSYFGYNYSVTAPTLENAGTFELTFAGSLYVYAYVTNTGTIQATSGTLNFQNGGLFGGTLTGGAAIGFAGGESTLTAGAVFNAAELYVDGGYVEISAGASFTTSSLYLANGSLQIDQNITLATGVLDTYAGTLFLNGNTLTVAGATLNGYIIGGGTLITNGATTISSQNDLEFGNAAVWINAGTVTQGDYVYVDTSYAGAYSVVNEAGATYDVAGDYYLGYYSNSSDYSTFTNLGTFAKTVGTSTTTVYGYFASTGTVSASTAGTIQFVGGGSFTGSVIGTGTVLFDNADYAIGGITTSSKLSVGIQDAYLGLTGNTSFGSLSSIYNASIGLDGFSLALGGAIVLGLSGSYTTEYFDGPGTLSTAGSTSILDYSSGYLQFDIGGGATWSNSGKIADAGLMQIGDGNGAGTLINLAGATFSLTTNDATIDQGSYVNSFGQTLASGATIINAGIFEKTGGTLVSSVYATLISTGTIGSTAGTLALDNGGSLSGLIADKSHVALTNGVGFLEGLLTVGGGAGVTSSVTVDATGSLTLGDSSSATLAATFNNSGIYEIDGNGGIVVGTGSTAADLFTNSGLLEKITGTGRSVVSANVTNSGSILANSGTLALTGTVTGTGKLLIGAGDTLELGSAVATTQAVTFTANTGTLALDTVAGTHSAITGFTVGDVIDLVNTAANSATLTGTTLVVYENSTAVATLSLTGTHTGDTYSFTSDGHGGTLLGIAANATAWKGTTADWNATNVWTNGAPSLQTNATVNATGKYTLSLAASETGYANTLLLDGTTATCAINGTLDIGKSITLEAGTLSLAGTINGGTLALAGGTINFIGGTLNNVFYEGGLSLAGASQSLYLENPLGLTGASGSGGATINITGSGAALYFDGVSTLNTATVSIGSSGNAATLAAYDPDTNGGVLILGPSVTVTQTGLNAGLADSGGLNDAVLNSGTIVAGFAKGIFTISGADFENDGVITVGAGDTLALNSSVIVNTGALTVTGSTLTVNGAIQNTGSLNLTNSFIDVGGSLTTAQFGEYLGTGNSYEIAGTLNNAGSTLTIGTGSSLGQITLAGGAIINGGVIVDSGNGLSSNSNASGAYGGLANMIYEGLLTVNGTTSSVPGLEIYGSFTATGSNGSGPGTIVNTESGGEIRFWDNRTLSNVNITLGNSTNGGAYLSVEDDTGNGATLNLASSVTISQAGTLAYLYYYQSNDQIVNQGTILAGIAGGTFYGLSGVSASFTNQGTIAVSNGDTFALNSTGTFTNLSGNTLTGGTVIVGAGSVVQLANNSVLSTDAATLALSGAGASIEELNTTTNKEVQFDSQISAIAAAGALTLSNGRNFNATANHGTFSVGGLLNLGSSNFTATALNIAGGTLGGSGTVSGAVADGGAIDASGGTLVFVGAVTGSGSLIAASGATVDLTQSGALTEAISGGGTLKLDGAAYTLAAGSNVAIASVAVDASATLSGTGAIGGAIADAGTVSATSGTLFVGGAVTGSGSLSAAASVVLDLAGGGSFGGAISGAGTLQLDGATTFTLLAAGSLAAGTVLVDAPATLDLNAGGAIGGTISGGGTLKLDSATPYSLAGSLGIASLLVDAGAGLSGSGTIAGGVTDNGSLGAAAGTLVVNGAVTGSGTLFASGSAVLSLQTGGPLTEMLAGAGTLQLNGATAYTIGGATLGGPTLAVNAGATLSGTGTLTESVADAGTVAAVGGLLQISGALSGTGALSAGTGAVVDLTTGEALTESITGAGTLQLDAGTYTLAGATMSIATVALDAGATLSGTGTIAGAITDNGVLAASGGTLVVDAAVTGSGSLYAGSGAVLSLQGGGALAQASGGAGTLQLNGATAYTIGGGVVAAGNLAVSAGATLSGTGTLTGSVADAGTVAASGGLLQITGALAGSGALIAGTGAVLNLTQSEALAESITGAGTLQLDTGTYTLAGASVAIATLALDAGATLSGTGTLVGAVTDNGAVAASGGTLVLGVYSGAGAFTIASGAVLDLTAGGTLANIANLGTLKLDGATAFTLAGTLGGGTIDVDAGATLSGFGTISSIVLDAGSIAAATGAILVLTGAQSGNGTLAAAAGATLELTAAATLTETATGAGALNLAGASGTSYTLAGDTLATAQLLVNAGIGLSGYGTISGAVADTGTIVASGGRLVLGGTVTSTAGLQALTGATLDLAAGGTLTQPISGAGTLELSSGFTLGSKAPTVAALVVDTGAALSGAGSLTSVITDNGSIAVNSGTLTLSGGLASGSGTLSAASGAVLNWTKGGSFGGALSGAGTVEISTASTLTAGASLSAATVLETASVTLGAGENIANKAGDVYDLSVGSSATISGSGDTFTNAGTFMANGAGSAHVAVSLINSGVISATAGTLTFAGAVTNTGTIAANGGTAIFNTVVNGAGTVSIGASSTVSLMAGSAATQAVSFAAVTGALDLTTPAHFLGTIGGFGGSDIIDLVNTAETGFSFANSVLTVTNNGATVASLHFSGSYTQSEFALASDGHGGTAITFV